MTPTRFVRSRAQMALNAHQNKHSERQQARARARRLAQFAKLQALLGGQG